MIGHVFWDEALQRIAPAATAALDSLTRRELAYGRETSAFEGTREFVFKHHVLHQVAYQGVLKQSRREQHRLTADWLVVRSGDRASEYFGLIAEHYERAGDIVNAVDYLRQRRRGRGAQLRQCGRARLPRPRPRARPRRRRGDALRAARDAARHLQQHRPARRAGRGRRRARAGSPSSSTTTRFAPAPPACARRSRSSSATTRASSRRRRARSPGRARGRARRGAVGAHQLGARAAVPGRLRRRAGAHRGVARRSRASSATAASRATTLGQLGILATQRGRYGVAPRLLPAGARRRARDRQPLARERHDQQPRRDRAAARQLRRRARAVPGRPAPVRRDRPARRRCLPAVQHGAERVPARRCRRRRSTGRRRRCSSPRS